MAPGRKPATLGPVLEFMRSLWGLEHALSERSKHVRKRHRLTSTERLVVRVLGETPGTSAGAVAGILHILPSTLTPVLQKLVSRGLVRRDADPLDRRRAVLSLTGRGQRIDEASAAAVDEAVRRALAKHPGSEVFHARRVMDAISGALGEQDRRRLAGRERPARAPRRPTRVAAARASSARAQTQAPAEPRRSAQR